MNARADLSPSAMLCAMRNLLLLLLGLTVGAAGAASAINVLRQRDAYPRGLMAVMQHHYAALRGDVRENRCKDRSGPHLQMMRALADGIESAVYPDDDADSSFREHARRFRDSLSAAPTDAECPALEPFVAKIGEACDACHRQYR
jgi:hypothetical protein